jgi:hypothetical protein
VSFGVSFFSCRYPAISFPFLQKKVPSPFPKLPAKTRPTSGSLKFVFDGLILVFKELLAAIFSLLEHFVTFPPGYHEYEAKIAG